MFVLVCVFQGDCVGVVARRNRGFEGPFGWSRAMLRRETFVALQQAIPDTYGNTLLSSSQRFPTYCEKLLF